MIASKKANYCNTKAWLVESIGGACPPGTSPITNTQREVETMLHRCEADDNINKCLCVDAGQDSDEVKSGTVFELEKDGSEFYCNGEAVTFKGRLDVQNEEVVARTIKDWC